MSNLGVRILYDVLNKENDIWCERVYAPWPDMIEKMEEYNIPLSAVESGDAVKVFIWKDIDATLVPLCSEGIIE